jgi:hypothetical protein
MEFGAIRDDLISLLALGVGRDKATQKVADLEAMIRSEAETGAKQAIPTIRTEVRKEVSPWVITALVVSGVALLATVGTVIYVRRKHR